MMNQEDFGAELEHENQFQSQFTSDFSDEYLPKRFIKLEVEELVAEWNSESKLWPRWWSFSFYLIRDFTRGWPPARYDSSEGSRGYWSNESIHEWTLNLFENHLLDGRRGIDYLLGIILNSVSDTRENKRQVIVKPISFIATHLRGEIQKMFADYRESRSTITENIRDRILEIHEKEFSEIPITSTSLLVSKEQEKETVLQIQRVLKTLERDSLTKDWTERKRLPKVFKTSELRRLVSEMVELKIELSGDMYQAALERELNAHPGTSLAMESISGVRGVELSTSPDEEVDLGMKGISGPEEGDFLVKRAPGRRNQSREHSQNTSRGQTHVSPVSVSAAPGVTPDLLLDAALNPLHQVQYLNFSNDAKSLVSEIISSLDETAIRFLRISAMNRNALGNPLAAYSEKEILSELRINRNELQKLQDQTFSQINKILDESTIDDLDKDGIMLGVLFCLGVEVSGLENDGL